MKSIPAFADHGTAREDKPRVALRLRAIRGNLSIDLDAPAVLGPIVVTRLAYSLPGLRFPVDLSGGVARFRHRRGSLELLEVECRLGRLAAHLAPALRKAWDSPSLRVSVLHHPHGLVVGLTDDQRALAFTALLVADDNALRWIVTDARAVGLQISAHAGALHAAEVALAGLASRSGSTFTIDDPLGAVVRDVLIDAGARTPDSHAVPIAAWTATEDGVRLFAQRGDVPIVPSPQVLRALALARIAEPGDDALAAGDIERAREAYLIALESAPRHPDLALRIAELDQLMQLPPQATLAALVDAVHAIEGGPIAARLLMAVGDRRAATVAARRTAESEPFAPLAALLLTEASHFADDPRDRASLLDEAVARSPASPSCRWARARCRLAMGDTARALADFSSIEAATRGSRRRFQTAVDAASLLVEHRCSSEAARFFERALRYCPRSVEATTGLARAFMDSGDVARGAALLARAVALTAKSPEPQAALLVDLASALADVAHDLPAAVAHARSVPFGLPQTVAARALEGRWRSALGDIEGAGIAYAQAREAFEALPPASAANQLAWLLEASEFESGVRQDRLCALRHVESALRAVPDNRSLQAAFRRLAAAGGAPAHSPLADQPPPPTPRCPQADRVEAEPEEVADDSPNRSVPSFDLPELPEGSASDEARIAALTDRIRAVPSDQEAAAELCDLLSRSGRDMDLFALVAARLEETQDPGHRSLLEHHKRTALSRLAAAARAAGRHEEASVYDDALADLAPDSGRRG